jgi:hypothetical protein
VRQAIAADAVEACRQDVQQEAPDKLVLAKRHGADFHRAGGGVGGAVVLPAETDGVVVQADEPAVGARDPVGVAGEIGEHRGRPIGGRLGVDHPLGRAQQRQVRGEGLTIAEVHHRELAAPGE